MHVARGHKLTLQPNGAGGLLVAVALALTYIFWGLPPGFVRGVSSFWQMETQDITVYVTGFMAFFQEPWHWPLLRIDSINWPEGTLATFVDAIPLYALLLKLLVPANVGSFNPYGYWIGLCLMLQAVGGWWALREARVNSWPALLALTCLLLTMPILQHRLGHVSLFSQWILVFAIALTLRGERLGRSSAGWCVLLVCALYINVYLTAMAAVLYAADLWRHRGKPNVRQWALWPLMTLALAASTMPLMMWPMPGHHAAQDQGFGIYSMNLLAPITGSRFLTLVSATATDPQAVEGFNYLGVGVMLLLGWLWTTRKNYANSENPPIPILNQPAMLWGLIGLLTVYALSNRIYFGSVLIAEWTVPDFAAAITGPLRASGRFFWPVVYVFTIFGIIAAARRLNRPRLAMLLSVVVLLQIADRWPAIQALYGKGAPTNGFGLNQAAWHDALGDKTTIYFYPKMRCAKNSSFYDTLLPVMRYAAERRINISTGYIARYAPDCSAMQEEARSSNPQHSAYVFVNSEYAPETISNWLPKGHHWQCRTVDFATVCTMQ